VEEGFTKLLVVVGHLGDQVRDYLEGEQHRLTIEVIENPLYASSNNIYSLWLARHQVDAPFLLVESDLVFDQGLLSEMKTPDRVAVAKLLTGMAGSTVGLDASQKVADFAVGASRPAGEERYKTVNAYTFSRETWDRVLPLLDRRVRAGHVHDYYEIVLSQLASERNISLTATRFDHERWIEVDSQEDLILARARFRHRHEIQDRAYRANSPEQVGANSESDDDGEMGRVKSLGTPTKRVERLAT